MVLDALLVGVLQLGLAGAAIATAMSQVVGGIVPLLYFAKKNTSLLQLVKPEFDGRALVKVCTNGSSEFLSNVSMSLVGMLYNAQLMKYAGENGVAAYGVLMYVNFVFISYFIGYVIGTAPIVSYHYGAGNYGELKNIVKKSVVVIGVVSVLMFVMGETLAGPFSRLFVGYNETLFAMTYRAFLIYSFSFLFAGISIFASSFFTALNNGFLSALVSFLRTAAFQVMAVLILPLFFDLDGIWLSVVVAEVIAAIIAIIVLCANKKRYHY
jgi:Na+-driven multidrug efflux pump